MGEGKEDRTARLRRLAEKTVSERGLKDDLSVEDLKGLLFELEVHQVELQMQNDELLASEAEKERVLQMYSDLYNFAPVGYISLDREGNITRANLKALELTGAGRKELAGRPFKSLLHREFSHAFQAHIEKTWQRKGIQTAEVRIRNRKTGEELWLLLQSLYLEAMNHHDECINISLFDITARREAEEALKTEHSRLFTIFYSMNDGVYIAGGDYAVQYVNLSVERDFGDPGKRKCYQYLYERNDPCPWCKMSQVFAGESVSSEAYMLSKGKTLETYDTPFRNPGGKISKLQFFHDITERKNMEISLRQSEKEKRLLLHEIHHRVKNNMQVITSLLRLQARQLKDDQAKEFFLQTGNRVKALALIHENLYQTEDLGNVVFDKYLRSLVREVMSSYKLEGNGITVSVDADEGADLNIETAIPCGLIISELISNSLKHAFPDRRRGEIRVSLHALEEEEYELLVSDNGIGLPEDIDIRETKTLGLLLVSQLAEGQLEGALDLERDGGTAFRIRFKMQGTGRKGLAI